MKSVQLGAAVAALIGANALATTADASVIDYVTLRAGQVEDASVGSFDLNGGSTYGIAIGKAVGPLRVELGVSELNADADLGITVDGEARDWSAMAYLDVPLSEYTSAFVGAGIDYVQANATMFGSSYELDGQGYSYAAGVATRVSDRMILEAQMRHLEVEDLGGVDLSGDAYTVGVRVAF